MSPSYTLPHLTVLNKTRRRPQAGDVFAIKPAGCPFYFGRVIRDDVEFFGPNFLSYIYRASSPVQTEVPPLLRTELLIPPVVTGNEPWTRGYFGFVGHGNLQEGDVLEQHCFRVGKTDHYTDENRNRLPGPVEPVGMRAMQLPVGVDKMVAEALGLPAGTPPADAGPDPAETASGDSDEDAGEQHLLLHLDPWTSEDSHVPLDLMELEEQLEDAVAAADAGEFSGHGMNARDGVDVFLYGPSCDALWEAIAPVMAQWNLHGYTVKRYGPPDAREVRTDLP